MHKSMIRSVVAAAGLSLVAGVPSAAAIDYPPPSKPSAKVSKPKGPFKTIRVCAPTKKAKLAEKRARKAGRKFCPTSINRAVKMAGPGDTVKVAPGTYKESVAITGKGKRFMRLIGDPKKPQRVMLEGSKKLANGVLINGADGVRVQGFKASRYRANGFFVTNANGYTLANLEARLAGVYGLYAFNTIGGEMRDSEAYWNSDSGFYVGQTPVQVKPVRTTLRGLKSWGNVLGYSGTNSRYVTITQSKFYNNGAGIVPNALDSEKWPPAENNVITGNEVFWNNYNYYKGAPFAKRETAAAGQVPFPIGVGILLYGGHGNEVTGNDVYGNWLVGVTMVPAVTLKNPAEGVLKNNRITANRMGLGGQDLNGLDIAYAGGGSGNCVEGNTETSPVFPEDRSTMLGCTGIGENGLNEAAQTTMFDWVLKDPTHEGFQRRSAHAPKPGYTPLEVYTGGVK